MYKKYQPEFDYSYTLGTAPTIDLLRYQLAQVLEVYVNSKDQGGEGMQQLLRLCAEKEIRITESDKAISRLSPKENVYAIGVFHKYIQELDSDANHVVLVNPSDMGNLGTIMRTMVSFGFHDLAIISPAADIFNPKAARASMGAMFQVNFTYFDSFAAYQQAFSRKYYSFMLRDAQPLSEVEFTVPFSLIFGSEGSGLNPDFADISQPVFIEQTPDTDSLNLSIAAGIALYQASKLKSLA